MKGLIIALFFPIVILFGIRKRRRRAETADSLATVLELDRFATTKGKWAPRYPFLSLLPLMIMAPLPYETWNITDYQTTRILISLAFLAIALWRIIKWRRR